MSDKLIVQLPPIRVSDRMLSDLSRLAAVDDRKFSDYVRRVLEVHCYGHARSLDPEQAEHNHNRD